MELSLAVQMQGFLLAIGAGFALAILYDVLKITRTMLRSTPSHVFWGDIVFMTVAAIVTFLLSLAACMGEVRFYILAGEGIGFCVYFLTIGLISIRVFRFIRKILDICLFNPLKKIGGAIGRWIGKKFAKAAAKVKKSQAKRKNRLKPRKDIVYNGSKKSKKKQKKQKLQKEQKKRSKRRAEPKHEGH